MKTKLFLILLLFLSCKGKREHEIPDKIDKFPLSTKITGRNALKQINRLHQMEIPVQRGIIAHYGKGEITLYLAYTENSEMANSLLNRMFKKMQESKGPFLPPRKVAIEGFKISPIFVTQGLGKGHFFFQKENGLYWLSSEPQFAHNALRELVDFLTR